MANQIIIDIGAAANDGTGDPLRTAFNYVNDNFSNVWNTGLPNSNVAFSDTRILTVTTNGNLILAPNGTGKVVANVDIIPNANITHSLGALNRRWSTVYTQFVDVSGNIDLTGDLTVEGNLTVNGTTTTLNTSNVDIEDKVITIAYGSPNSAVANGAGINVAGANANITWLSNISAWNFNQNVTINNGLAVGTGNSTWTTNGNFFTAPSGASWESRRDTLDEYISSAVNGYLNFRTFNNTSNVASEIQMEHGLVQINILNGGNRQWEFNQSGTFSTAGNIIPGTSNVYSLGNSTNQWADLWVSNSTIYMNSVPITLGAGNVLTVAGEPVLINDSNTSITTTGNITADYFFGNGSQLTGLSTNSISDGNSSVAIDGVDGNAVITTNGGGGGQWTFDTAGNLTIPGSIVGQTTVLIDNRATGNTADINLFSADDITLQARDRTIGDDIEGGDINIYAGDGSPDDAGGGTGSGGDIQIIGGVGGVADISGGGQGGFVRLDAGQGGDGSATASAGRGGDAYLSAGSGGAIGGTNGGAGGNVTITAGDTTDVARDRGSIILNAGGGGDETTVGGYVRVNIPSAGTNPGGNWTFEPTGNLTLPQGGIITEGPSPSFLGASVTITPANGTDADQQLKIYPTIAEGNHLHLTTGNLYNTELYLGDDNLYVKLANTGDVVINSNDGLGNSAQWTFGVSGNLTAPGNIDTTGNITAGNIIAPASTANTQILFNNAGVVGGSAAFTFDTNGNTLSLANSSSTLKVADIQTPTAGVSLRLIPASGITYSYGNFLPLFANTYDLGGSGSRWNSVFANVANVSSLAVTGTASATSITLSGTGTAVNASSGNILTNKVTGTQFAFLNGLYTATLTGAGATSDYTLNLPANAGANGQSLTSDGTGNLVWTTPASSYGNANVATFLANYGSNTISTTGNITAGNLIGNISITGNVTGTSPNVTLVAGSYSYVFDNTGELTMPAVGGDEGGQINFTVPATNTTLENKVTFDVYQNRVRIFEGSANARGVYIDLAKAPTGVSGEIGYKASAFVNAGVDVTLGNLRARIPSSGNRSLQISTVSGTYTVVGSAQFTASGTVGGANVTDLSVTTTPSYLSSINNFTTAGDSGHWFIMDNTAGFAWRISFIIGSSYNNNMITIERMV